mmetsp:Transcript_24701/g.77457  ORF Transcript_24701/g.77457 Transcript_24701/m.77457 type:complete len:239 (-) Transcript_24701:176-892(-)
MDGLTERAAQLAQQIRAVDLYVGKGPRQGTEEVRFRGTWYACVRTPAFAYYRFLPVVPPQEPRRSSVVAPPAPVEEVLEAPPEAVLALQRRRRWPEPPAAIAPLLTIRDRFRDFRAFVSEDGVCTSSVGDIIGYINADGGEAGSVDEELLGYLEGSAFTNILTIKDASGEVCGTLDQGTTLARDCSGRTVAELRATGEVFGHAGAFLGAFEGYTHGDMRMAALYLMLIDPGMLNETEG